MTSPSPVRRHAILASLGLGLLGAVWLGPLAEASKEAFSAHMLVHVSVVAVSAPLLAGALSGTRWDPVPLSPALFSPIAASVLELVVVWAWHVPALHHAARESAALWALEQGSFLVTGIVLWVSALGGREATERAAAGIVSLLLTSMHMTLLGALIGLAGRPLYHEGSVFFGRTPLDDQQIGGALMLLVGGTAYLTGGLVLTNRLLARRTT